VHLLVKPAALFLIPGFALSAFSQAIPSSRIAQRIDDRETVQLEGNVRPFLAQAVDQGRMDGGTRLQISIAFRRTAAQEAALEKLLAEQLDPASASYHKWLTPEQFAGRFGLSPGDMARVRTWLESQGFTVERVARSRTQIWFSGPISTIESAFRTEMHHFQWKGEQHFANATELSVPAALSEVVLGFSNLDDFRPKARVRTRKIPADPLEPHFTSNLTGQHSLIPGDFATIYDVNPVYTAGFDGTGQKLAVVGQTALFSTGSGGISPPAAPTDIDAFRSAAGLPPRTATNFMQQQVPGSGTAAVSSNDIDEANIDLEWSEAVAKGVTQIFVYTGNATNFNVFSAFQFAVDQILAPVISVSYGNCEQTLTLTNVQIIQGWTQQANAQGQTVAAAAGDFGAADCDTSPSLPAQGGIAVDVPGALPYVTSVGGTEFTGDPAGAVTGTPPTSCAAAVKPYWDQSCSPTSGASALTYIPETTWNDTALVNKLDATGGGASIFFSKPSWQTGAGVPADGARDVPDIALSGSNEHDPYLFCSQNSCVSGFRDSSNNLKAAGGTSFGAPTFAGIVAILNQKIGATTGQGNVNPTLYSLAATNPSAFHDITTGNNIVTCGQGTPNCPTVAPFQYGYSAGVGYDLVTGLGSLDVNNLANAWASANPTAADFQIYGTVATIAAPGGTTTSTITIDGRNGFSGAVGLSCTAPASALITCSLSSSSVTPGGASNTASATLTIKTTAASATLDHRTTPLWWTGNGAVFAGLLLVGIPTRRRRLAVALTLVALALVASLAGCGGGSSSPKNPGTPAGSYTVTVTGTSGSTSHTTNVSVVVH
jgi:subtilase family serine protease